MTEKIQSLLNDEESMRQIKELAEMFGGQGQESASETSEKPSESRSGGMGFDIPGMMSLMSSLSSEDDPNCNLILALKPLLSKDKQEKADRAVKMLKLYNAYISLKDSGMLNNLF